MQSPTCYRSSELTAYAEGYLPDHSSAAVARHLQHCRSCEATVSELESQSGELVSRLQRTTWHNDFIKEPDCLRILESVKTIRLPLAKLAALADDQVHNEQLNRLREYQLLEKLGAGGMGVVYKALHTKLKRVVALKVLPAKRMTNPLVIVRFEREMESVGKLDHPNIVRASDAGEAEGTHFLVMEYVDGEDLSRLVKRCARLPVAAACELVRQAAIGLQHAHDHGLVHRDIKPSNLILANSGQVKILDLGLALLQGQHDADLELTKSSQLVGTLDYMAPEQADDGSEVDFRADIYGLGATLYKLLSGRAPFASESKRTPLSKLRALATQSATPIRERRADVDVELAEIVERMLAPRPSERFASAQEVADALAPFARDCELGTLLLDRDLEPQSAPPHADQQIDKPMPHSDSNRPADVNGLTKSYLRSTMWVLVATAIAFVGIASFLFSWSSNDSGDLVVESSRPGITLLIQQDGETVSELKVEKKKERMPLPPGDYTATLKESNASGLEIENKKFTIHPGQAAVARIYARAESVVKAPTTGTQTKALQILDGDTDAISSLVFSNGDRSLVCSGQGLYAYRKWKWREGIIEQERRTPKLHVLATARAPDRTWFAVGTNSGTVLGWRWPSSPNLLYKHASHVSSLAISPDGTLLASASHDDTIKLWDVRKQSLRTTLEGHQGAVHSVAISNDSFVLASAGQDGLVKLWDIDLDSAHVSATLSGHKKAATSVIFLRDGNRLASASHDATIRLWNLEGELQQVLTMDAGGVTCLALSPDGQTLAAGSLENTISLWDMPSGQDLMKLDGHQNQVTEVAFSDDGKFLASGDKDGQIRVWQLELHED